MAKNESSTSSSVNRAHEKDREKQTIERLIREHNAWEKKNKLKYYVSADRKTTFLCQTPERGAERLAENERKLKMYK